MVQMTQSGAKEDPFGGYFATEKFQGVAILQKPSTFQIPKGISSPIEQVK
jgi:hypothetical protein